MLELKLIACCPRDKSRIVRKMIHEVYYLHVVELPHDKTNKMACVPSEDSDQPGHPTSLIRVFTVSMKKAWVLSYSLSTQRRL